MELSLIFILSCLLIVPFCLNTTDTLMLYRTKLCDVQARIAKKCMTEVSKNESLLKCCVRCSSDLACIGASIQESPGNCFIHTYCTSVSGCTAVDSSLKYFEKNPMPLPCVLGSWNKSTGLCDCPYNYVGDLCERRPYNCTESFDKWRNYNNALMGIRPKPITSTTFISCRGSSSCLESVIMAYTGEFDFNKTWFTYGKPFSYHYKNFWLGLSFLPLLLGPNGRNMRIDITFMGPVTISHRYTGVVIGNASTNYQFSYLGHTLLSNRTDGNCLELSNMTSFSTWDMDNDGDNSENWAMKAWAGWWFPAFNFTCNPMGSFYDTNSSALKEDGYVRIPGLDFEDLRMLKKFEMVIEEDYIW